MTTRERLGDYMSRVRNWMDEHTSAVNLSLWTLLGTSLCLFWKTIPLPQVKHYSSVTKIPSFLITSRYLFRGQVVGISTEGIAYLFHRPVIFPRTRKQTKSHPTVVTNAVVSRSAAVSGCSSGGRAEIDSSSSDSISGSVGIDVAAGCLRVQLHEVDVRASAQQLNRFLQTYNLNKAMFRPLAYVDNDTLAGRIKFRQSYFRSKDLTEELLRCRLAEIKTDVFTHWPHSTYSARLRGYFRLIKLRRIALAGRADSLKQQPPI
eukprot:GHVS01039690.1.p1 GENE.GHVS01039690.1~~GHVS01039690.1.p1  ORF type:complete len:262 (+),score=12.18 GHVS01039690.1:121-906(+)